MADYFIGEIRIFPYHFVPQDFLACNGQTMAIAQFQALYAVIGLTYGGDGQRTFQLPNLNLNQNNMAMVGAGQGPNLSNYTLGRGYGMKEVSLSENQMPAHNHNITAINAAPPPGTYSLPIAGTSHLSRVFDPSNNIDNAYSDQPVTGACLAETALTAFPGQGNAHDNQQPYLGFIFAIATDGVFPQRP